MGRGENRRPEEVREHLGHMMAEWVGHLLVARPSVCVSVSTGVHARGESPRLVPVCVFACTWVSVHRCVFCTCVNEHGYLCKG